MNGFDPAQYTILLVDDIVENIQVLGSSLRYKNYKVEFATNGIKALDWLKKRTFDLLLLDLMMPGMDGHEVCRKIREDTKHTDMPIIFLTAKVDKESVLKGFRAGAQDYITKPFNAEELLSRVKIQLELKTAKEQLQLSNQKLEEKVIKRTAQLADANKQLVKANTELLELDKSKSQFLNIISSEIRIPLNGVLSLLHILKYKVDSADIAKYIRMLDESVRRLEKFSEVAHLVTSLRLKKQKLEIKPIKLLELLEFSVMKLSEYADTKNVTITVTEDKPDVFIEGDYKLLLTCCETIIENQIKHTKNDSRIDIVIAEENNNKTCEFIDQGEGFPLEKIEQFNNVNNQISQKSLGLDFSLAKMIMENHNSYLTVSNTENGGASIKLIFK